MRGWPLLVLALAGCKGTLFRPHQDVQFDPYSSSSVSDQTVDYAVVAYEGDIPSLQAAGAEVVGSLSVVGDANSDEIDVQERARRSAARRGGTHLVVVARGREPIGTWSSAGSAMTTYNQTTGTAYTTYQAPSTRTVYGHTGRYLAVRVPTGRWAELPPALRP